MFYKGKIIAESNQSVEIEDNKLIEIALKDMSKKTVSKIIQIGKIRIGITSFRYKQDILAFAAVSQSV